MTERIVFTMAKLNAIPPAASGERRMIYDAKTPGLVLRVTETGAKGFYIYGRYGGKPRKFRLGAFPALSVEDARSLAREYINEYSAGRDPGEAKRKERNEITLGELWPLFLEYHGPRKKASSLAEDHRLWKKHLSPWSGRKIASIESADVRKLHMSIGQNRGRYAANRALSLLSTMFTVARNHGVYKSANPCAGIQKFPEQSRERFLSQEELGRLFQSLDADVDQQIASVFRLCLFTGARRGNVLSMRWADVDLDGMAWNIPDTKAGEPQCVPLVAQAVKVLMELKGSAGDSPFVFPAMKRNSKTPHLHSVHRHWAAIIKRAGLPGVRIHDLRRTMGSWQAIGGESLLVIGKSLGHKKASTSEIYARLQLDPVRAAMEKATTAMMAAGKKEGGEE